MRLALSLVALAATASFADAQRIFTVGADPAVDFPTLGAAFASAPAGSTLDVLWPSTTVNRPAVATRGFVVRFHGPMTEPIDVDGVPAGELLVVNGGGNTRYSAHSIRVLSNRGNVLIEDCGFDTLEVRGPSHVAIRDSHVGRLTVLRGHVVFEGIGRATSSRCGPVVLNGGSLVLSGVAVNHDSLAEPAVLVAGGELNVTASSLTGGKSRIIQCGGLYTRHWVPGQAIDNRGGRVRLDPDVFLNGTSQGPIDRFEVPRLSATYPNPGLVEFRVSADPLAPALIAASIPAAALPTPLGTLHLDLARAFTLLGGTMNEQGQWIGTVAIVPGSTPSGSVFTYQALTFADGRFALTTPSQRMYR